MDARKPDSPRDWLTRVFSWVEDIVYVGLGAVLAGCALTLLATGAHAFWQNLLAGSLSENIVQLLDRLLLILLIVEVMYTVQVSFRQHTLAPEPFLMVGLIAVVRRLLVLTAELPQMLEKADPTVFRQVSIELALLAGLIVALVASLVMLRRHPLGKVAERG
ncbi:MAG TPA: phosphate-starvation-inducible PsiE family protein [Vicinamibacterales bacterium]|nr:phosphate-starvation-inducible PsiE family protein [Vicinamibacterales bacterium]